MRNTENAHTNPNSDCQYSSKHVWENDEEYWIEELNLLRESIKMDRWSFGMREEYVDFEKYRSFGFFYEYFGRVTKIKLHHTLSPNEQMGKKHEAMFVSPGSALLIKKSIVYSTYTFRLHAIEAFRM